ncbi:hypothetical protein [Exiguobacterium sp.]|uniref:hypothetical protein n=1 Tax=Exiguobacterium sp. TaxID=44751 RepID=UPI00263BE159|nr:hypothetical protein [Exiguobacterium sp.]
MEKQQRMRRIVAYQKKWMPLHVTTVIAVGMSFALFLMNGSVGYLIGFFVALAALTYMDWKESRFLQQLTKEEGVKRLIPRQYVLRGIQAMFGALAIYGLFQQERQLYILVVLGVVVGLQSWTARYYEQKIQEIDAEQPSRDDMRFLNP